MDQALEVSNALSYYSANDLDGKLERITGHGINIKPNKSRFPNQPEKNRGWNLAFVLDMSKDDLAQ